VSSEGCTLRKSSNHQTRKKGCFLDIGKVFRPVIEDAMNEFNPIRKNAQPAGDPQDKSDAAQIPVSDAPSSPPPQLALRRLRAEAEIHAISQALKQTGWNRRRAAELLSISYRGLLYKIRQYDITSTGSQLTGLVESSKFE
jgi:DNA-binding NtrC family response regulator